jgi:oligopeptide/dipeptide ABC transporter ATP-binding protein
MAPDLVVLKNISKSYQTAGYLRGKKPRVMAVQDVTLSVRRGEILGLMGESGSGKSTLARLVAALEKPSRGKISIDGLDLEKMKSSAIRNLRREMQIIFQDPCGALDPLQTVKEAIEEPLLNFTSHSKIERSERVVELLRDVGLPGRLAEAYPHQLSGGECQRVCIARALASRPKLLICDEPVSALDKSIQAQILNLLQNLQRRQSLTYLFISHDLAVMNHLCTRIAVMLGGRIIEEGSRLQILLHNAHPYTRSLVAAATYFSGDGPPPESASVVREIPEKGCVFQKRCSHARARCSHETPAWQEWAPGHWGACHFPLSGNAPLAAVHPDQIMGNQAVNQAIKATPW